MRRRVTAASILLSLALGACGSDELPMWPRGLSGERPFLRDPMWDDGNAEIASYDAREARYGILRDGEAILISVKEDLDALTLVKADGPRHGELVTAVKLNTVLSVPAGVYTYRQMASSWLLRETARPIKLAVGSQEWCGLTHKTMTIRGPEALMRESSYFGAEGERVFVVAVGPETVLFDTLPLWLRTLDLEETGVRTVQLVESEISNRALPPVARAADVEVQTPRPIDVAAGSFDTVPVEVRREGATDVFFLQREAPHTLVRWDRADGGRWSLHWVRRAAYWDMNAPEDVGALERTP